MSDTNAVGYAASTIAALTHGADEAFFAGYGNHEHHLRTAITCIEALQSQVESLQVQLEESRIRLVEAQVNNSGCDEQLCDVVADNQRLQRAVDSLFTAIEHGDEKHHAWLREKINLHFGLAHNCLPDSGEGVK